MIKRFILAPDSFKGTMTAVEVCDIWQAVILNHIPDAVIRRLPMADGGEGMVDAYLSILGGKHASAPVSDPFGNKIEAAYGLLPNARAVMEMSSCAGLPLVGSRKDPLHASTFGVGELLLHAYKKGVKDVLLGIGGSATNDCGIGMAAALGYKFYSINGELVEPFAKNMINIYHIEPPKEKLSLCVTAACDVDNPLYGPTGATYTFGMQKGADSQMLALLDAGLENMAEAIERSLGICVSHIPGSGAAGGLGAGIIAFLGGTLTPGIDLLLDAAGFNDLLLDADIVFTGEGRIDWQSAHGKVPVGVAKRAKTANVPCIALCGAIGDGLEAVYEYGLTAVFASIREITDFDGIKKNCREDMRLLVDSVLRLLNYTF